MNKKLHILFLSNWYPSKISPSNGNFIQKHAEAIATKNDVTIVFSIGNVNCKENYIIDQRKINNVNTIIVYFKKHLLKPINWRRKYKALKIGISKAENFDLIHCNIIYPIGLFAFYQSFKFKVPFVISEHWSGYLVNSKNKLNKSHLLITKFIVKKTKFVIPVSKKLQIEMRNKGINGQYKVIGNVVNTTLFHPKKNKEPVFTITHISSLNDDAKNISGILRVIKSLSEIRTDFIFKIISENNITSLKNKINKLKIPYKNIEIDNTKTPIEVSEILQKSDLYISFSNYETFGIVMVESIACGTPVISTNTGILSENDFLEFATIIPLNDENELLLQINDHMDNPKIHDKLKMNKLVESKFGIEIIANSYTDLYNKLIQVE